MASGEWEKLPGRLAGHSGLLYFEEIRQLKILIFWWLQFTKPLRKCFFFIRNFTCNIICDFAQEGRWPHEFRFFLTKIALNLERGVWHFLVIVLKTSCYFCSDSRKARPAKRYNLFLYEPGNRSVCKFNIYFYDFSPLRLLG